jgi:hypothetical protein
MEPLAKPYLTETNRDFEVRSLDALCINESELKHPWYHNLKYLFIGILFGIILVKAEIISWFRIQEMFRLGELSYVWSDRVGGCRWCVISVWLIRRN